MLSGSGLELYLPEFGGACRVLGRQGSLWDLGRISRHSGHDEVLDRRRVDEDPFLLWEAELVVHLAGATAQLLDAFAALCNELVLLAFELLPLGQKAKAHHLVQHAFGTLLCDGGRQDVMVRCRMDRGLRAQCICRAGVLTCKGQGRRLGRGRAAWVQVSGT